MFKKEDFLIDPKNEKIDVKQVETLIGPSVKVEGDFVGEGDVVVEGMVTGKLKTKKNLRIGQNAQVLASVSAENALVAGLIQGNIKIREKLELTPTAKIKGDIQTKTLIINEGATFTGNCKMEQGDLISEGKIEEKNKEKNQAKEEKKSKSACLAESRRAGWRK